MSYFPEGYLNSFEDNWVTTELLYCGETSLWQPTQLWLGTVYRLVYLPTFEDRVMLRVTLNGEAGHVVVKHQAKSTYREAVYYPSEEQWLRLGRRRYIYGDNGVRELRIEQRFPLCIEDVNDFQKAVTTSDFWNLESASSHTKPAERDGTFYVLECRREDEYRFISHCWNEYAKQDQLVLAMMRLAGWSNSDIRREQKREEVQHLQEQAELVPTKRLPTEEIDRRIEVQRLKRLALKEARRPKPTE